MSSPAPAPTVREIDPERLLLLPSGDGVLRPYLPRDVDAELDRSLSTPGAVVMIGSEHFAGARRSAYEALLRNRPDAVLQFNLSDLPGVSASTEETVLWLDYHGAGRGALQADLELMKQWRGGPHLLLALTNDENLRDLVDRQSLADLNPHLVWVRRELTTHEQAELADRGLEAQTVEQFFNAVDGRDPAEFAPSGGHSAGYRADTDTGNDRLGLAADVRMLADLVASRQIRPPLSIGIFGNWGSGKSFFMRQMNERVEQLVKAAAEAEQDTERRGPSVSAYCASVHQITFNAWHYTEANLWASLATQLFDHLAAGSSEDDLERRARKLAEQRTEQDSLQQRLSSVRVERTMLTAQLNRPSTGKPGDQAKIAAAVLRTVVEQGWLTDRQDPAAADAEEFVAEVTGLRAEARNAWRLLKDDLPAKIMAGVGLLATVTLFVVSRTPLWPLVLAALTLLGPLGRVAYKVRESVAAIRGVLEGKEAQRREPIESRLTELAVEQEKLERAVAELTPMDDLATFAASRGATQDYQQHLGVVSLIRRDLETFAAMLDADRKATKGERGPERIVLYIDDLDRCPPDVVIKVLEAVHLLLALPVFTIVVGVDARWLLRAIREHYSTMLDGGPGSPDGALQYLEKIFQIPFMLSPMNETGFAQLIADLGRAEDTDEAPVPPGGRSITETLASKPPPAPAATTSAPTTAEPAQPAAKPRPTVDLRPRQLAITQHELDFLAGLASLVPSPRAAKRLVNLYRLSRARLSSAELNAFLAGNAPEAAYRAVLVLLAVLVGPSGEASTLFQAIDDAPAEANWPGLLDRLSADGSALAGELAGLPALREMPYSLDTYRNWLPLVARFSFTVR
ncbi:P-loop NTPase fold protein [Amycolatopsis nigrescens]|uniref:P-loop NTPase fold protein n=1 Tax=Amycolatopsis nigrescens TaxID=381445 RepID=UPI000366235E|nr:P-loop NTPase fold protein [Amycolatopsis nigrescens]